MRGLQILLLTLFTLSACAKKDKATTPAQHVSTATDSASTNPPGTFTYLALGDSYTVGESVPQAQSYPYQLIDLLNSHSLHVDTPKVIATTGWTTDDLIDAIAQSGITDKKFDFVTLLIGVNDQYQGLSQDNYKIKFAGVLNTAIKFANSRPDRVFVISIPDWGVTPFGAGKDAIIGPEIDQFNAINKAISVSANVNYIDITAISRQAATDLTLIAKDGLHPSGAMYKLWVAMLEPIVAAQLKK